VNSGTSGVLSPAAIEPIILASRAPDLTHSSVSLAHLDPLRVALSTWARSVRDSYVALLPLTFLGVLAILAQQLPLPGLSGSLATLLGPVAERGVHDLLAASQGIFGLALATMLAVQLGRHRQARHTTAAAPLWLALAALVNFIIWLLVRGDLAEGGMGQGSTLLGVLVGSYTPWLMARLERLSPAAVRNHGEIDLVFLNATRATLPLIGSALVTLALAMAMQAAWGQVAASMSGRLPTPESLTDSGTLLTLLVLLVNQGAWAVGIHGGKIVDAWLPGVFAPPGAAFDPALAWRPLVDNFVHLGGSGATLGLAIALLVAVRSGPQRRLAKASLLPSVFNVNELLVFGLPVVLHPRYLLPFIGVPLVLALAALAAIHAGWLPVQPRPIHWTTPVLLSGWLLTGSWVGAAWQALGVALSVACYLPVVRRVERLRLQAERQAVGQACLDILAARGQHQQALRQSGQTGEIARVLLADLRHDLHTPALHLAYQPKHGADGRVTGVEALLRWSHARFGPVRADAAITLAEDGRLVQALGLRVLEQACACKARWNVHGLARLTMSVNVSPMQLDDHGFADAVADVLRRHGLAPGELELEITESQAIPRDRALDHNMARLHHLGVRVAIDDFGMGHSSLVHLRRFQIHAIKIDGSLTREVLTQPTCADIVRSIAGLAQSRGLDVVAEFVEATAQRDLLAALGCTHFQGYLHAPPLPEPLCLAHLLEHGAAPITGEAPGRPAQPAPTAAACT